LGTCCNLDCDNWSAKHHRCGKCRRKNRHTCAICDNEASDKAIFCKDCAYMSRSDWAREYSKTVSKEAKYKQYVTYYKKHRLKILLTAKTKRINRRLLINNHAK